MNGFIIYGISETVCKIKLTYLIIYYYSYNAKALVTLTIIRNYLIE
jgi:hypothetical protein